MSNNSFKCPHCGQLIKSEAEIDIKVSKYVIRGAIIGFIVGAIFDNFYFYIGVITDFFTFMPIIHLVAGALLGMLVGWVIGEKKYIKAARSQFLG